MSYGQQLNIFRAKAQQYGLDWKGLVCGVSPYNIRQAAEDAIEFLKGDGAEYFPATRTLRMPNGATLRFKVVNTPQDAERAFRGMEYTQIAWLYPPDSYEMRSLARSRLRSRKVPADDLRYEYVTVL